MSQMPPSTPFDIAKQQLPELVYEIAQTGSIELVARMHQLLGAATAYMQALSSGGDPGQAMWDEYRSIVKSANNALEAYLGATQT